VAAVPVSACVSELSHVVCRAGVEQARRIVLAVGGGVGGAGGWMLSPVLPLLQHSCLSVSLCLPPLLLTPSVFFLPPLPSKQRKRVAEQRFPPFPAALTATATSQGRCSPALAHLLL